MTHTSVQKKNLQGQSLVLMDFPDMLKFFNRIGIRPVNDVTAQVTADVTAAMDPEGMGVHMGPSTAPLPLGEDPVLAGAALSLSDMLTKSDFMCVLKELVEINQENNSQVMGHVMTLNNEVMGHVMTLNTEMKGHVMTLNTEMKGYVDRELEAKGRELEAKFEQRMATVLGVQGKPPKKRAKRSSKRISTNILFAHGKYSWRKTIKLKKGYKGCYKTLGEAKEGLAKFCEKEMQE